MFNIRDRQSSDANLWHLHKFLTGIYRRWICRSMSTMHSSVNHFFCVEFCRIENKKEDAL
ncbi:hypothetical protein BZL54_18950 [Burkholderia ubonensis subsp. mesacidophila]|uniref:Uncharacterized protein n=1 Tax=Burkholderia ubonensis subsp. mesacidophila TaxID=265293 RepID=A0A2A4FEW9_9BURK|nr:hypothetical protein BZL54_18950 [Burkholderia ubonensis subsp. mesacidophila]